jgi:hypothetical protein
MSISSSICRENSRAPKPFSRPKWLEQLPKFNGDAHCVIHHVVSFLQYASEINVIHDDILMNLFVHYLEG